MKQIILYSSGCPQCRVLKKKLEDKNIQFTLNTNVEQMEKMGFTRVPILEIDGELMDFAAANKWINEQEITK